MAPAGAKGQQQQRRQHGTDSDGGGAILDWQNNNPKDGSGGNGKTVTTVTSAVAAQTCLKGYRVFVEDRNGQDGVARCDYLGHYIPIQGVLKE